MSEERKKKILITGANGFFGTNLTILLSQDSKYEVFAMVRPNSPIYFLSDYQYISEKKQFEFVEADLTDINSIEQSVKNMDIIIHLAGKASDWGPRESFMQTNVKGTQNLLEIASKYKISRFIYLSSLTVHGLGGHKFGNEMTPTKKYKFPYAESKIICEGLVENWAKKNQASDYAIIRPGFLVYGPYDRNSFTRNYPYLISGKLPLMKKGKKLISYSYIENLCYGIKQLVDSDRISGAYTILDGNMTWKQWVKKWANAGGTKPMRLSLPYWLIFPLACVMVGLYKLLRITRLSPPVSFYSINIPRNDIAFTDDRMQKEIGYQLQVNFDESISRTMKYYDSIKKKK